MTALDTPSRTTRSDVPATAMVDRPSAPVKVWAAVGAFFVALQIYIFASWIGSGNAKRTPDGPDQIPDWMLTGLKIQEVVYCLAAVGAIYFLLVRPWRRQGRLTFDGMLVIGFILIYWQDPLGNYLIPFWGYNSHFTVQFGSWAANIPGWVPQNGNLLPEPLLASFPTYPSLVLAGVIAGSWGMRKAKERWPGLGRLQILLVAFVVFLILDLVAEVIWVRLGWYSYWGVWEHWSLFPDKYYTLPLFEPLFGGIFMTAWASLRYFRDDKGLSWAERGVDTIKTSSKRKTGLQLLAVTGALNVVFLAWNVALMAMTPHMDHMNKDVLNRSYFLNGICGGDSGYACPGRGTPAARTDSAHLTPEGELIIPQKARKYFPQTAR